MAREQSLSFGKINLHKVDQSDVLYYLSGKKMYEIGSMSGEYPPLGWRRPGFLVGKRIGEVGEEERPVTAAHYLYEMGGIWAHPIKAIESLYFSIQEEDKEWLLKDSDKFINHFAYGEFFFSSDGLEVVRTDFIVEDEPALFVTLSIKNNRHVPMSLMLSLKVQIHIMPSWFSGLMAGEDELEYREGKMVAYNLQWRDQWAVVFGSNFRPIKEELSMVDGRKAGSLFYKIDLQPGEEVRIPFLFVVENSEGYAAALVRFDHLIGREKRLFEEKIEYYQKQVFDGVKLDCSDPWAITSFYAAKANMVLMLADLTPYLGRYFFAGLPEYVQLFGTDTSYSVPGMMSMNFGYLAKDALGQLGIVGRRQCGRIPHEVTTNGRVFHPGNTQETPQFTIAVWSYFKWSGDKQFLSEIYPLCREGVIEYVLAHWDMDLDYYPDGNAMVERLGMGTEKLDSACYFCKAIYYIAMMAEALGKKEDHLRYLEIAQALREAINQDFWIEEQSLFADSLGEDHEHHLDGHWTVAVPMETDIADRDKGARALAKIEEGWLNRWGMVHTKDREELVWTLPTGVLAMAEFAYGNGAIGWRLINNIAETMNFGMLGAFKELIPEGLCFIQLWSPALYLQGIAEGVFGVDPRADLDYVELFPKIPAEWTFGNLEDLDVGDHKISILVEKSDSEEKVIIRNRKSDRPLNIKFSTFADPSIRMIDDKGLELPFETDRRRKDDVIRFSFTVNPYQEVGVFKRPGEILVGDPTSISARG